LHPNSNYILLNGIKQEKYKVFDPSEENKFIIHKDLNFFPLYLSYADEGVLF
jgi:hypothetical protein